MATRVGPPEPIGPMGYWKHPRDSITRTLFHDQAYIGGMQEREPLAFQVGDAPKVDDYLLNHCKKLLADEGIEDGLDLTIVERAVGIVLDDLPAQQIGSCVASSHIALVGLRSLIEIVILGSSEDTLGRKVKGATDALCPFGCFSYRAGRRIAGINGNGDGSMCGPQIEGSMQWGTLPCDTPGLQSDYYPEPQSASLYRQWGAGNGLMDRYINAAAPTKQLKTVRCDDADTAKDQILNYWAPLQICSGWGFGSTGKQLPNGDILYRRSGSWSHSMQVVGFFKLSDGNWYVKIRNQWGKAHNGKAYFVVTAEEFSRWIRDSNTLSIAELEQRRPDGPWEI